MAHDARLARRIIQRPIAHPGPRVELMMYLQNKPETWGPRGRDLRLLLEPDAEVFMHTSSCRVSLVVPSRLMGPWPGPDLGFWDPLGMSVWTAVKPKMVLYINQYPRMYTI